MQCTFWLAFVLPDGRTRERQPVATYTDVAEDAIERELIVDIGCIQPGVGSLESSILQFRPSDQEEFSRWFAPCGQGFRAHSMCN